MLAKQLSPSTIKQYKGLAQNFYLRLNSDFSPSNIASHLKTLAYKHKPDVWRKLRRAIAYDQLNKGYIEPSKRIAKQQYPSTVLPSDWPKLRAKVKRVKEDEFIELYRNTTNGNLKAALILSKSTGCRPAEMLHIKALGNNKFFIPSAKKTEDGLRGLDRTIKLSIKEAQLVEQALKTLAALDPSKGKTSLQKALERASKKTWPRRKKQITFYSFRHQMSSDLKSAGVDLKTRSYIMGHQSTASISSYGDVRYGTGACGASAGVSYQEIDKKVRESEEPNFEKIKELRTNPQYFI